MADVLIRGVQFPTMAQAYKMLIVSYDGKVYEGVYPQPTAKKKEPIAHAVELPEHGDLIDREWLKGMAYSKVEDFGGAFLDTIDIAIAPVVIPSNKEDAE